MATTNRRPVMTLYSLPDDPFSHRVRLALAEKGINVEIEYVDPTRPPEDLVDLNPYQTLPTLVDRDLVLFESLIIQEYLDERFPHPPLMPVDPVSRAQTRLMLHRIDVDWYTPVRVLTGAASQKEKDGARRELGESLAAVAGMFAEHPYFMSDEFSLLDCSVLPLLWRLPAYGVELPSAAEPVLAYCDRMFERPAFRASLSETERESRL